MKALARRGADVTFTGRSEASVAAALSALGGLGSVHGSACDVIDRGRMSELARDVDILVNNAALGLPVGRLDALDPEAAERMIAVNLVAPMHAAQAAIPGMVSRGGGTIINMSSGAAQMIIPRSGIYCVSKAGLAMLTRAIHADHAKDGIRVFGFGPGMVATGMQDDIIASGEFPDWPDAAAFLPPAVPARAVAWLCTPEADDLAGRELSIRDTEVLPALGEDGQRALAVLLGALGRPAR